MTCLLSVVLYVYLGGLRSNRTFYICLLSDVGSCIIVRLLLFVLKEKGESMTCVLNVSFTRDYCIVSTVCQSFEGGGFFSQREMICRMPVHFFAVIALPMLRHFGGCKYELQIIVIDY